MVLPASLNDDERAVVAMAEATDKPVEIVYLDKRMCFTTVHVLFHPKFVTVPLSDVIT